MNQKKRKISIPLLGCVLGAITYFSIYGFRLLDVTNTLWLYDKGDLTQHYAGWLFYRNSHWFFPFGLMDTITYPHLYSIVYSDAIPILAVFFKLLSPLLPASFQYFGIWGLLCFILQGVVASCILKRFFDNTLMIAIGVLFFTCSPWMIQRLYIHSSLAAHWILLLCILMSLRADELSLKRYTLEWSLLFALSAAIHVYFIPMCAIFLGCNMLYRIWKNHKNIKMILTTMALTLIPILSGAAVLWFLGAFSSSASYNAGGYGEASANLNFLFNSLGNSELIPPLPHPFTKWPEESFGYLGLGVFLLLCAGMIRTVFDKPFCQVIKTHIDKIAFTLLLIFICIWLATNPEVAWNEYPLFRWVTTKWIEYLLGIFRSLGRFVWPICYVLLVWGIVSVGYVKTAPSDFKITSKQKGSYKKALQVGFLLLCMVFQLVEFRSFITGRANMAHGVNGYRNLEPDRLDLFIDQYDHIYNFDFLTGQNWEDITIYAGTRHLTLNESYLGRIDWQMITDEAEMELDSLWQGQSKDDTLYLFPLTWEMEHWKEKLPNLNIYKNSGFYIGSRNPIEPLKEFQIP